MTRANFFRCHLLEPPEELHARQVHPGVDAAETFHGAAGHFPDLSPVGDVGGHPGGFSAHRLGFPGERRQAL